MAKKVDKKKSDEFFEDVMATFVKSYGEGFETYGESEDSSYEGIPTGHDDLDALLTKDAKGLYLGGIVEIIGSEGSGKTSVAMRTVGTAQKLGYRCLWIDAETGFSEDLAEINGVDLSKLVKPDLADLKSRSGHPFPTAGEILDMVYNTVNSGVFGIVVVDSVAGLMPGRILSEEYDPNKPGVAEIARAMSEQLPRIHIACAKTKTMVIFINQIRMQPGNIWNPETTPGGRALPFYADQRIRVEKVNGKNGDIYASFVEDGKEDTRLVGHYARVKILKNKKHRPVRDSIQICVYYEEYFPDDAKKAFLCARDLKVIRLNKSTLTWKDGEEVVEKHEGESDMMAAIRDKQLEGYLAYCCIKAEAEESNQKLKEPVKVSAHLKELAEKYVASLSDPKTEKKAKKTKKGDVSPPPIDLDA